MDEINSDNSLSAFPNPSSDVITIRSEKGFSAGTTFILRDAEGKIVWIKSYTSSFDSGSLFVDDMIPGIYHL